MKNIPSGYMRTALSERIAFMSL